MAQTVGVVGAGRMGTPIIGFLAKKGFRTLAYDVNAERRSHVESMGAQWAPELGKLAAESDFILICVGFDREVRDLLANNGALRTARPDTVIAILSTVNPKTVQELADARKASRVHVVDSAVCGGGAGADEGTLLSFVGGHEEVVARLTPVLQAYSAKVVHTGSVGSAQVAKAANNLIMWACLIANHEALALAKRYGLDVEALRKTLLTSSCSNKPLGKWGLQTMAWAEDDLVIVQEMAAECGISLPQAGLNREICRALKPRRYKLDQYGV